MQDFHQSAGKHLVRKEEEKKSRKLCASWRRWRQRAASLGCSCDQSGAEEKTFAAAIAHHGDRKVAHKEPTCTSKSRPPLTGSWANEIVSCISNKRRSGTLLPTYLPRAGAPRVRKRGPGSFSRPSAQVSASLDALFPDHFGAGETTAGAKPRNPCVCFLSSTPRERKKRSKQPFEVGMGGKREDILQQNQLPGPRNAGLESGVCFRDASPSLSEVPAASAPLWLGPHTAPLSAPQRRYWPCSGDWRCWGDKDNRAIIGRCCRRNELQKKKVDVVIVDLIKTFYAAQSNHRVHVGTCASTDLITGSGMDRIKRWL